jgi:hypothetical protein
VDRAASEEVVVGQVDSAGVDVEVVSGEVDSVVEEGSEGAEGTLAVGEVVSEVGSAEVEDAAASVVDAVASAVTEAASEVGGEDSAEATAVDMAGEVGADTALQEEEDTVAVHRVHQAGMEAQEAVLGKY